MEWYTYMQDASEMYKTEKKRVFARARARSHVWELVAEQAQFHACAFERTTHTNP